MWWIVFTRAHCRMLSLIKLWHEVSGGSCVNKARARGPLVKASGHDLLVELGSSRNFAPESLMARLLTATSSFQQTSRRLAAFIYSVRSSNRLGLLYTLDRRACRLHHKAIESTA